MLIFRLQFFISCLTAGSYLLTACHLHYASFVLKSRHCIGMVFTDHTILMQLIGNDEGKLGNYGLSCADAHVYFC